MSLMSTKYRLRVWGLFIAVALLLPGCRHITRPPGTVTLELSASVGQPVVSPGEYLDIALTLTNTGTHETSVSSFIIDNLQIISFRKDGIEMPVRRNTARTYTNFGAELYNSLVPLTPGQQTSITWKSARDPASGGQFDPTQGAQSFNHIQYRKLGASEMLTFLVNETGQYEMEFFYQYSGPVYQRTDVYTGRTNTMVIRFEVIN